MAVGTIYLFSFSHPRLWRINCHICNSYRGCSLDSVSSMPATWREHLCRRIFSAAWRCRDNAHLGSATAKLCPPLCCELYQGVGSLFTLRTNAFDLVARAINDLLGQPSRRICIWSGLDRTYTRGAFAGLVVAAGEFLSRRVAQSATVVFVAYYLRSSGVFESERRAPLLISFRNSLLSGDDAVHSGMEIA